MTVDSGGGGGGVGGGNGTSATTGSGGGGDLQWYFSQVKGTTDEEINEADIISTVEFNEDGELLATGDKGGRIVIFQREQPSKSQLQQQQQQQMAYNSNAFYRSEYNVYSTFQSHEAEFDYLKSLEIEEKINKIKWLRRKNAAHFLLSTNDKTVKLWKIRERNKRSFLSTESSHTSIYSSSATSMFNGGGGGDSNASANSLCVRDELNGYIRSVNLPVVKYMDRTEVEAVPKRVFANAHTYHINSISLNSDQETFMSADDLRINLWHIEITNQSFNIVDIKPANMEELAEVITAAEFHPKECNLFAYSSSRGTIRLCDMRQSALCDTQAKLFEEREDPSNKNFFSEIISSISDLKFSHSGRYLCTRDYLYVKVWDLNMENRPVEVYPVHDYLRSKLCILYENDCIFDKFECNWSPNDEHLLSGSYNNFFKSFNRGSKQDQMYECSREQIRPRQQLRPKRVVPTAGNTNGLGTNGSSSPSLNAKRGNTTTMLNGAKGPLNNNNGTNGFFTSKDEVSLESLDLTKKILHTSWHPKDNIIAIAATNNLYLYYAKEAGSPGHQQTLYSNTSSFMNSAAAGGGVGGAVVAPPSSFNCINPSSGALNNNNNNNTNNNTSNNINSTTAAAANNSFANANRVPPNPNTTTTTAVVGVTEPTCLSLNTSFYTPSSTTTTTNNGTNSSTTSLLTSPSSSTISSTSNSSTTTIPINGGSPAVVAVGVVPIAASVNTAAASATVISSSSPTSSNITTPPVPLPLTTTNSMSL